MKEQISKRNDFIDYLKGILIILVVYGHAIQFMGYKPKDESFFEDPVFKFIYIFHMPLFMLVSGYLSEKTFKKYGFAEFFTRKIHQLILPVITWALLRAIIKLYLDSMHGVNTHPHSIVQFLKSFILNAAGYWYIWALLLGFLVVFVCRAFKEKEIIALLVCNFLVLLVPDAFTVTICKFILPFFCIGYLFSKLNLVEKRCPLWALLLVAIISIGIYVTWKPEFFIYNSVMVLKVANIPVISYRFFAGLVFSFFMFEIFKLTYKQLYSPLISKIGQHTLSIYLGQYFLFAFRGEVPLTENHLAFNLLVGPIATALIVFVILQLDKLFSTNGFTRQFFLGQERRRALS